MLYNNNRTLEKLEKTLDYVSSFVTLFVHFFHAPPLPTCFTTEQNTVEPFYLINKISTFGSFLGSSSNFANLILLKCTKIVFLNLS